MIGVYKHLQPIHLAKEAVYSIQLPNGKIEYQTGLNGSGRQRTPIIRKYASEIRKLPGSVVKALGDFERAYELEKINSK